MKKNNTDITTFSEKLVNLISAESRKEREELLKAFQKAKKKYMGSHPVFSWVCLKPREAELADTISMLTSAKFPLNRLKEVRKFFSEGGWESNSANTLVLHYLSKAINVDEKCFDQVELKERLLEGIQSKIKELNRPTCVMTGKNYSGLYKSYKKDQDGEKADKEQKRKEYNHMLDQLLFSGKKDNNSQIIAGKEKQELSVSMTNSGNSH